MKKLLALLLAVVLAMSLSLALAETEARDAQAYPNIAFGADQHTAIDAFNQLWSSQYSYSQEPVSETVDLSDGTKVTVVTLAAVPSETISMPMTVKFYFTDGKLAAAVQEIAVPEESKAAVAESVGNQMGQVFGTSPVTLNTKNIGRAMELVGEEAHLQDGQDAWTYAFSASGSMGGEETPIVFNAMMTARVDGDTLYMTEFVYSTGSGNTVGGLNLAELEGFDKLSVEEQSAVKLYAEFQQQKQTEELKQYIEFLQKKHQ